MRRTLSLYWHAFAIEARQILAYRWEFWTSFLGQTLIVVAISYYLWAAIFEVNNVKEMNGMNLNNLILYYLMAHMLFKAQQGFGVGFFSRDIYYGTLNKFLLYPFSSTVLKFASYSAFSVFYYLQLIFLVFFHRYTFGNDVTLVNFLIASSVIVLGVLCYYFMTAIIEIIAFWADNVWSLGVLMKTFVQFFGGYMIPLSFYPETLQEVINYTPFPYFIYYPAQIFLGQTNIDLIQIYTVLGFWTLFSFIVFKITWVRGNRRYTGVGI